jgi:hypothetical protein
VAIGQATMHLATSIPTEQRLRSIDNSGTCLPNAVLFSLWPCAAYEVTRYFVPPGEGAPCGSTSAAGVMDPRLTGPGKDQQGTNTFVLGVDGASSPRLVGVSRHLLMSKYGESGESETAY